jgi:hypothetical protein
MWLKGYYFLLSWFDPFLIEGEGNRLQYLAALSPRHIAGVWKVRVDDQLRAVAFYHCGRAFGAKNMGQVGSHLHNSSRESIPNYMKIGKKQKTKKQ